MDYGRISHPSLGEIRVPTASGETSHWTSDSKGFPKMEVTTIPMDPNTVWEGT